MRHQKAAVEGDGTSLVDGSPKPPDLHMYCQSWISNENSNCRLRAIDLFAVGSYY